MAVNISKLKPFDKIDIIRRCNGFTSTQKLLLFTLASHLGLNHWCWLSLTTLENETGLSRTSINDNLTALVIAEVIHKRAPQKGKKSNQYAINFGLLVALDYQTSSLGLLDQCARATRLVAQGYPKRNINKIKENEKEPFAFDEQKNEAEKAKAEIRKMCGIKARN
jgi:hypothetical protein